MNTPDDVFDMIPQPEDITPRMAEERRISAERLEIFAHMKEESRAFAREEKERRKNTNRKVYSSSDWAAWRLLYDGGMKVRDIAKNSNASEDSVYAGIKKAIP